MTCQTDSAVVFFSRDGNTRRGAEILNQRLGGRLVELKERRPGNALHALLRMKSPLDGDPWGEIAHARRVFLMCPIWAWTCVPAMNAFADRADFTDKDVYIVTFQQAVNPQISYREHQHLAGIIARNHGSVRECYALVGAKMGQFAGEEHIREQIETLKLPEDGPGMAAGEPPSAAPEDAGEIYVEHDGGAVEAKVSPAEHEAGVVEAEESPAEHEGGAVEAAESPAEHDGGAVEAEQSPAEHDGGAVEVEEIPEQPLSAEEDLDEKTPARETPPIG